MNDRPIENTPRPAKVLLVVEPGVDGVFRHVEGLTNFLRAQPGVQVSLAYSSVRGGPALARLAAEVAAGGGRTLDLRVSNAPRPGDLRALARLRRLVREVRPDVIHAHSSKAGALVRGLALTGGTGGAPVFYTPNAYYQMHGKTAGGGRLKRWFYVAIERALGRVGATIHVSASEMAYARATLRLPPSRQHLILNGADGNRFRPAADAAERRALRAELGLPADALLLGTVARLSPQKDSVRLYEAVLSALAARPGLHFAHLNAVGELAGAVGATLAAASAEARARVHQRAALEDPARFYRALDAFTLPSLYEGLSFAAIEAAASGLPLLLTACPGNVDLRPHGFDHLTWAPPGNVDALREQILTWADEAASASATGLSLVNNHQAVTRRDFDLHGQFGKLRQLYGI